eukprot:scaffold4441_cov145-Skeletonema_menzelii.AAC.2
MASLGQRTYLPASSIITMKLSSSKQTDLGAALVWLLVAKRRNLVAYLWQHHCSKAQTNRWEKSLLGRICT